MKQARFMAPLAGLLLWPALAAQAQGLGVASVGATGGLHIPSAYVLGPGEAALSLDNDADPKLGRFSHRRNHTLGFGLGGGLELFGRLADYQNPRPVRPGAPDINGPRDLSANLKWQLPLEAPGLPRLALGLTDISGGATYFRSAYAVASDELGPLRWTLGYARGQAALGQPGGAKLLDGPFGGAELRLWGSRATLLAETDGSRRHAGLRYYSAPLSWLGEAQLIGSLQRSFGATDPRGQPANATSVQLALVLPLQADDATRERRTRAALSQAPLPAPSPAGAAPADPLPELWRSLRAAGLDRVRVGTLGADLVVEYENQRYLHNEVDALGVVLGLAAEQAPAGTRRVHAITRKAGLVVSETSVDLAAYRAWLRDEAEASAVQASLGFGRLPGYDAAAVQWAAGDSAPATRLRLALKPLLNYTVGTEYGVFDHSLAVQVRASTPLWRGAELYADLVQGLSHSDNMAPGRVFASSRHRDGLQTVALQQSFWLGPRLFNSLGLGRYQFDTVGAEGESILFLPWGSDSLHLRGRYTRRTDDQLPRITEAYAASYRWRVSPNTWLEGGLNAYTDRSHGPSLAFTRWFGDVALQLFARKGGANSFVGLELSLPLAPRQGMGAAPVQVTGSPRFAANLRTLLTDGGNTGNWVRPDAVRPVSLSYPPEVELLNAGRLTPEDLRAQLPRLRESFYLHARRLLP